MLFLIFFFVDIKNFFLNVHFNQSKHFIFSTNQSTFNISILDVFGYENFKNNSIEQLMINTVNEELQSAFYRHSFNYDQLVYQREGVPYPQVSFKDNKKICDLLLQVLCFLEIL